MRWHDGWTGTLRILKRDPLVRACTAARPAPAARATPGAAETARAAADRLDHPSPACIRIEAACVYSEG